MFMFVVQNMVISTHGYVCHAMSIHQQMGTVSPKCVFDGGVHGGIYTLRFVSEGIKSLWSSPLTFAIDVTDVCMIL